MRHVLVVANETLIGAKLTARVHNLNQAEPLDLQLVVPATGGSDDGLARATSNLAAGIEAFEKLGIAVTGRVGQSDPMAAVTYSLAQNPAINLVIVSTLPLGASRWVAMDLPHRISRRFGIGVEHIIGTAATSQPAPHPRRQVKVLLIEDNADDIELATLALESLDHDVELFTARTGANALEYIAEASPRPDLILLDLKMPVMDGFTMLEQFASRLGIDALNELNVVIVSSSAAEKDRERAYALGAHSYVVKQPDYKTFRATLASLVAEVANKVVH